MKKHIVRFKILMTLLNEGYAYDNVLRTLDDSIPFINKCISQMIDEKYIKTGKRSFVPKNKNKKEEISFTFKMITPKGVQWLIDNYANECGWLRYLPDPMPSFYINRHLSGSAVYRMAKSITASIMFSNVGIRTFSKSKSDKEELRDIVDQAKEKYRKDNGIKTEDLFREEDGSVSAYYHGKDIKSTVAKLTDEGQQHAFLRNHGLLFNRSVSYLVYVTKAKGFVFRKRGVDRVRNTANAFVWENRLPYEKYGLGQRCIVFCKNEKEFADLFFANYRANQDTKEKITMRDCFVCIHAVPVSRKGVIMLADILNHMGGYEYDVVDLLSQEDTRYVNSIVGVSHEDASVLIGTDMDMVKIEKFYAKIKQEPEERYIIVCHKWQKDYYQRIMSENVEYHCISDDFLQK